MVNSVIITDMHLAESNHAIFGKIIEAACEAALAANLPYIFCAGDVFESRKAQTQANLLYLESCLDWIHSKGLKMVTIPGNHDKTSYQKMGSFLSVFKHHPGIHLIEKYGYIDMPGIRYHFIPYFAEEIYGTQEYGIELASGAKNILITHIAINGVKNNDGSEITNGVGTNFFAQFDYVLIGHYHNFQMIGEKIIYMGSTHQHNFGEDPDKGIFSVFVAPNGDIQFMRDPIDGVPKYITERMDASTMKPRQIMERAKSLTDSVDRYRFAIAGNTKQIKSIDKVAIESMGIKTQFYVDEIEEAQANVDVGFTGYTNKTIVEAWPEFCEAKADTMTTEQMTEGSQILETILTNGEKIEE